MAPIETFSSSSKKEVSRIYSQVSPPPPTHGGHLRHRHAHSIAACPQVSLDSL